MDEQRAVSSTLQIFGCSRVPTLDYLLDVVRLNLTKEFLTLNKETLKTAHKNLSCAVEKAITADSCVDCGVITTQDLYCMALDINLISNRGVHPGATLINTMDQDYALHFKRVMQHIVATKANTYGVELKHLPKNTQPKNTVFNNWCTIIEEQL